MCGTLWRMIVLLLLGFVPNLSLCFFCPFTLLCVCCLCVCDVEYVCSHLWEAFLVAGQVEKNL